MSEKTTGNSFRSMRPISFGHDNTSPFFLVEIEKTLTLGKRSISAILLMVCLLFRMSLKVKFFMFFIVSWLRGSKIETVSI